MKYPKFETMISAMDFEEELNKMLNLSHYDKEKAESIFGVKIILEDALPPGSALLIDKDGRIVAVIQDQELVEIPQDSAINHLANYPLLLKKRPCRKKKDMDHGSASRMRKLLLPGRESDHE